MPAPTLLHLCNIPACWHEHSMQPARIKVSLCTSALLLQLHGAAAFYGFLLQRKASGRQKEFAKQHSSYCLLSLGDTQVWCASPAHAGHCSELSASVRAPTTWQSRAVMLGTWETS